MHFAWRHSDGTVGTHTRTRILAHTYMYKHLRQMNEVANMADSLDFSYSYSYSCRNTATLPSPILSVDIYKSTVIIYGPYRSRSRSRSRALINFSTHTHTRDGMYRMSRLWPARVSSAHQLGHLISASGPSSKLN